MSACQVCEGASADAYASVDDWTYVRCNNCGFVYLAPMPTQAELNRLYQSDDAVAAGAYPKARSRRRRALLRALRLWRHLRHQRVIDVGCGGGFMVEACRRVGASASGLDIDEAAINYARQAFPGNTFYAASFDAFDPAQTFDVVYSSELIEHVARLDDYMKLMRRLTRSGSKVLITTPDIGSPKVPQPVAEWDVFGPPYHVQFFDQHNLARLFERYGFRALARLPDNKTGLKMLFCREAG